MRREVPYIEMKLYAYLACITSKQSAPAQQSKNPAVLIQAITQAARMSVSKNQKLGTLYTREAASLMKGAFSSAHGSLLLNLLTNGALMDPIRNDYYEKLLVKISSHFMKVGRLGMQSRAQALVYRCGGSEANARHGLACQGFSFGQLAMDRSASAHLEVKLNNTVKQLQQSILEPDVEGGDDSTVFRRRQSSALDYTLAIDHTASKTVAALIGKCRVFQALSLANREECAQLVKTLEELYLILTTIQGSGNIEKYKDVVLEIQVYATKAYAFIEKLSFKAMLAKWWMPNKAESKFDEFSCKFFDQKVQMNQVHELNKKESLLSAVPDREERPSFGVTTFVVATHNSSRRLYSHKRVVIPLIDAEEGKAGYTVEMRYPRTWLSKDVPMRAKIESTERGFSQVLKAERVKMARGSWGWQEAQDTVTLTYEDLVVATMASASGSLLTYGQHVRGEIRHQIQKYRTGVQIVGSSRIDLDLQHLFITGYKRKGNVYYKCYVDNDSEEILAIYRYYRGQFQKAHGVLHVIGRGNQPGLRHLLVSIFASLGFTSVI